ncbi:hypothetical protein RJ55_08624 [Drechmeria coniospora]|nr:hypothetical protein RJ55_08624 [Drechmeria coniospora]
MDHDDGNGAALGLRHGRDQRWVQAGHWNSYTWVPMPPRLGVETSQRARLRATYRTPGRTNEEDRHERSRAIGTSLHGPGGEGDGPDDRRFRHACWVSKSTEDNTVHQHVPTCRLLQGPPALRCTNATAPFARMTDAEGIGTRLLASFRKPRNLPTAGWILEAGCERLRRPH